MIKNLVLITLVREHPFFRTDFKEQPSEKMEQNMAQNEFEPFSNSG